MPNYAYKTPDGNGIFRVVLGQPLEDETKTIKEADLWPVDATIPEGMMQDFAAGKDGWFLENGTVKPCVKPIPEPEPMPVPFSIPMFKLRLWLIGKGLLSAVENIINTRANWPDDKSHAEAVTLWEYRPDVLRSSAMVNSLGDALGMTQTQIDTAFIEAETLT